MNTESRLKIEMAIRVRDFLRAHPFTEPNAVAVVAQFEERLVTAQGLVAQQENGVVRAKASRTTRAKLRSQLRSEPLRQLAEIARSAATEEPGLVHQFRQPVPNPSEQEFRTAAHAFAARAAAHRELLLAYGMRPGLIEELNALLAEYDAAITEGNAGRRDHTGARSQLKALASELVRMVHRLNAMMLYQIRDHPELGGAWNSARNIAWPMPRGESLPPTDGTGAPPADPTQSAA